MKKERCDRFQIGSFTFEINHTGEIPFPESFMRFLRKDTLPGQQSYELILADRIPQMSGEVIALRSDIEVVSDGEREKRVFRFLGVPIAYGCYEELDGNHCRCMLQRDFLQYSQTDTVFCSLFALERHLLAQNGCVLHCAALCVEGEAVLFSGPSGIGKSTHAKLWTEQVPGSRVFNGDRALLQKREGRWHVSGWPVSGSSDICFNETYPLHAVVFLRQEKENCGVQCNGSSAVKALVSQMTVNQWNTQAVTHIWELAEALAEDVPVYSYGCNTKPEAVQELQKLLGMED